MLVTPEEAALSAAQSGLAEGLERGAARLRGAPHAGPPAPTAGGSEREPAAAFAARQACCRLYEWEERGAECTLLKEQLDEQRSAARRPASWPRDAAAAPRRSRRPDYVCGGDD